MKVLITGATGLVGNELVPLLLKNGVHVNYLTTSKDKIQRKESYNGYLWNPKKGQVDENCIEGVDAVIHLAGASIAKRWTAAYKNEILESRVASTNLLYSLLQSKQHSISNFISASAIGIYPDSLDKVYSEEDTVTDGSFLGGVVQQWEAAVNRVAQLNIKVAKVRTGMVLSGKGGVLKEMAVPARLGLGTAFGSGKQMQSWIHLHDLAGIYLYILKMELGGTYNAVAPYPVDQNTLSKTISAVLDKPFFLPNIPKFAIALVLGEMSTLLLTSQNVSAKKIISEGYQFKYLSLEKAIHDELN